MNKMGKENKFIVETEGNCFLCSIPILTEHLHSQSGISIPLYSLQCLSRYLKMDMKKVFNQNQPIPQNLLKKVNDSRLMVLLCSECATLNEEFSGVYGQLERIQMEVAALIKVIHGKLASNCEHRLRLTASDVTEIDNVVGKRQIAEVLRKEASHNCSQKLNEVQPGLRIQKLTRKQINAEMIKLQPIIHEQMRAQLKTDSENIKDMDADSDTLEMEHSPSETEIPSDIDEGGDLSSSSDSSFDDDDEKESSVPAKNDDSVIENKKPEGEKVKYFINVVRTSSKPVEKLGKQHATINPTTNLEVLGAEKDLKKRRTQFGKQHATLNPTTGKSKCNVCSKEFSCNKATFDHYRAAHLNIRYSCRMCKKEFKYLAGYYTHVRNFHKGVTYSCHLCKEYFKKKINLDNHLLICAGTDLAASISHFSNSGEGLPKPNQEAKSSPKILQDLDTDMDTLKVGHPSAEIPTEIDDGNQPSSHVQSIKDNNVKPNNDMNNHKIKNQSSVGRTGSKYVEPFGNQHATLNPATGKMKCNVCSTEFSGNQIAYAHYRSAHLNIRYRCRMCQKEFKYRAGYHMHVRTYHLGIRFTCPLCNTNFTQKTHMTRHMRTCGSGGQQPTKNTGQSPSSVKELAKSKQELKLLRENLEVLDAENGVIKKPLALGKEHATLDPITGKSKCNVCSKEFSCKNLTIDHYKAIHLNIRYKCIICEKIFKYRGGYYGHVKRDHEGVTFPCHLCKKSFKQKHNLVAHLQKCGMKEPPKITCHCAHCGKGFSSRTCLLTHIKGVHLQLKNWECSYCNKRFMWQGNLESHRRKVHRNE